MEEMKSGKKIVKWGPGFVVFITREARVFGWNDKTFVRVIADKKSKRITIEELGKV